MKREDLIFERIVGGKYGSYWFRVKGETADELTKKYREPRMIEAVGVVFDVQNGRLRVRRRFFPCYYDTIPYYSNDNQLPQMVQDMVFEIFKSIKD